ALLCKIEMGTACYAALAVLIVARFIMQRFWKNMAIDVASVSARALACILVARWMISLRGLRFITEENIVSWPGTYYMRTFGKQWLEATGFAWNGPTLLDAATRTALVGLTLLFLYRYLHR